VLFFEVIVIFRIFDFIRRKIRPFNIHVAESIVGTVSHLICWDLRDEPGPYLYLSFLRCKFYCIAYNVDQNLRQSCIVDLYLFRHQLAYLEAYLDHFFLSFP